MTELGTYGVMIEEGKTPFCLTLELPWLDNKPMISCIPKGEYTCQRIMSPKRGFEVFEVMNVPNRDTIEIHKGNFTTDILGCILVGEQFQDTLNSKADKVVTSVQCSGDAFQEFMKIRLSGQQQFKLVILEC